jgi:uncharacterized membrane protein YkgB
MLRTELRWAVVHSRYNVSLNGLTAFSFSSELIMSSPLYATNQATTGASWNAAIALRRIGAFILRYSLVFFLFLFGALKWTPAEANGIQPMVSHSPLFFWLYPAFGVQRGSEVIGVIELILGVLIGLRRWSPRLSAIGSLGASAMFVVTLSFLVTTPNIGEGAPFLLKDITLLGAALWTASEALTRQENPQATIG